ncbi:unnamed protein product, partial [marine sediment metagenome]
NYMNAYTELATLYSDLEEFAKAEEVCAKAAEIDSKNLWLLNTMGTIQAEQGKFAEAIEYYKTAIKTSPPTLGPLYNNMGEICFQMGQYDKAIECYTKAIEHRSKYAHTGLGYVYLVLGEFYRAESTLLQAIQNRQYSEEPKIILALTYLHQGKREQARQYFDEAMKFCDRTQRIDNQLNKVIVLLGLHQIDEALQLLEHLTDNFTIGPIRVKGCLRYLELLASAPGAPEGIQRFLEGARVQLE